MLKIRREQMEVFDQSAARSYEAEMVRHLQSFAPRTSEVVGEAALRRVVQLGVERAGTHGFTNRGPVRFYLELMTLFGSDFDTDPQLHWAAAVLTDPAPTEQMARAERLHAATLAYLDDVDGPRHRHSIVALRRIDSTRLEDVSIPSGDFDGWALGQLKAFYPQKYAYVGEPALRQLIQRGIESATHYGATPHGAALFIALMFAFGHGVTADPLYPWVSATLTDATIAEPEQRLDRLRKKVRVYLSRALAYVEKRQQG
jgi:hypothetical protein